jgi:hypothetical protein
VVERKDRADLSADEERKGGYDGIRQEVVAEASELLGPNDVAEENPSGSSKAIKRTGITVAAVT